MGRNACCFVLGLSLLVGAVGCLEDTTAPRFVAEPNELRALGSAQRELARVATGNKFRGEQDEMLLVETQVAGFAGYYVDSLEQVVLLMKEALFSNEGAIRSAVAAIAARRGDAAVRERLAGAARARVEKVRYSLSELIAMEQIIYRNATRVQDFRGIGVNVETNKLLLGVPDSAEKEGAVSGVERLGVPREAITALSWGPTVATATFRDLVIPSAGGLQLAFRNTQNGVTYVMSHGFNVYRCIIPQNPCIVPYFMTVAHGANIWHGVNGHTGAVVDQPWPGYTYGTIAINPAWETTGCGVDPATGLNYTFCTWADVALGTYSAGTSFQRKVRTSTKEGTNGAPGLYASNGSVTMNNTAWSVQNAIPPELIASSGNSIHKSGYRTGTTTGAFLTSCYWGAASSIPWPSTPNATLEWRCISVVDHAGWGLGDSGGVVFGRNTPGGTYFALGIQVGGSGPTYASGPLTGVCSAGAACRFLFNKWSDIEYALGFPLWAGT